MAFLASRLSVGEDRALPKNVSDMLLETNPPSTAPRKMRREHGTAGARHE
ncbi:hypothetical protein [Pedomonas mirosovicensis]|nr:hypothetical protein [Pedomonas mirosovicensis]MCH8686444.1 hypothetical protein [Pedomonas mirosovicensis]